MRKVTVHGGSNEIARAIENMEKFGGGGNHYGSPNFSGEPVEAGGHVYRGRLEGKDDARFTEDFRAGRIRYVIYSYGTPIMWLCENDDGTLTWYRVGQKFSASTTRHQTAAYMAAHYSRWEIEGVTA